MEKETALVSDTHIHTQDFACAAPKRSTWAVLDVDNLAQALPYLL